MNSLNANPLTAHQMTPISQQSESSSSELELEGQRRPGQDVSSIETCGGTTMIIAHASSASAGAQTVADIRPTQPLRIRPAAVTCGSQVWLIGPPAEDEGSALASRHNGEQVHVGLNVRVEDTDPTGDRGKARRVTRTLLIGRRDRPGLAPRAHHTVRSLPLAGAAPIVSGAPIAYAAKISLPEWTARRLLETREDGSTTYGLRWCFTN
jgi:hypothetical protein